MADLESQLRRFAKQSGLTRFALARVTGIPYQRIHPWAAGKCSLSAKNLSKLADALGVSLQPTPPKARKAKG